MPIGLLFWFLWILCGLSMFASNWPGSAVPRYVPFFGSVISFVLFGLLGWHVFGAALHS